MARRALITGITGQDGSYLAEFLLANGYEVHGLKRRSSSFNTARLDPIYQDLHETRPRLFLHYGDLTDSSSLARLLDEIRPEEVYNLAAQSHVRVSFEIPEYTTEVVACGALRLLEAIRRSNVRCRYYQASSSEMFGASPPPQNETTPFRPRSPYGCAKVFAHLATVNYRNSYGLHACCGILFNHESPRRGETFVTRKITRAVARIRFGLQNKVYLGNLEARRDWGWAPDYVRAMWLMLQQERPDDFVIGTGESHTVREFAELAFAEAGLDYRRFVEVDPRYFRPAEIECLQADAAKARRLLDWAPAVGFRELVRRMVAADIEEVERTLSGNLGALRAATARQASSTGARTHAVSNPAFWDH